MITDQETNFVYFSSLITERLELHAFWYSLEKTLHKAGINYGFIQNTGDIWCRDYMPLQINKNEFTQFTFDPGYLKTKKYKHLRTDTDKITYHPTVKTNTSNSPVVLDGGNLVRSKNSVVLTNVILQDNDIPQEELVQKLKQTLLVEHVHLLPKQPYDFTGHADGMVRFLDDHTLLVANHSTESASWKAKYQKALASTGLKLIDFPAVASDVKNSEGDYTALGCYINFAWIGSTILFPQFDLPEDVAALQEAKKILKGYKLIPVPAAELAMGGGVLNCVTWNIKV
ncbi:agmatine deiminase family protein [Pontibacter sp. KCTC 32443]|uniref:agmatine deiminase family protein n=1 Tax=Pontibacter TaxID=323449 RepID=UPI00164D4E50|nr:MULTISPECIES: agmatine deiminase family protein [Pontibacter]MBC5772796.1 agmatine deiminase family protein [Pontibacter sp. KCTC 32443]